MPLRIAFDLDGVLADMDAELRRQATILFGEGTSPPPSDPADGPRPPTNRPLTPRQAARLWRHIATIENFWESLHEIEEGAIARLWTLALDRRWEVIFLTKRPETAGATAQVQSQRWLASKGFTLPSVFVVAGSRSRIAASLGLDFVIDDRPKTCLDVVADSTARAILVWRDEETLLPAGARELGIGIVKTVAECLDVLTEADVPPHERTGVVERLMKALGRKDQPAGV